MKRTLIEALKHRRSHYSLGSGSPVMNEEIMHLLRAALRYVPSAFNSQTTRIVLLLGDEHKKLWQITKDALRKIVPEEAFAKTESKIDRDFASGHGTVLFFEDNEVVQKLQSDFPLYKENFPIWAQHTSAMHQLTVWAMLTDLGLGASLQHYNPLIDEEVRRTWKLPDSWQLVAQMPFGMPTEDVKPKATGYMSYRIKVFQ